MSNFLNFTRYKLLDDQDSPFSKSDVEKFDLCVIFDKINLEENDLNQLENILLAVGHDKSNTAYLCLGPNDRIKISRLTSPDKRILFLVFGQFPRDLGLQIESAKYTLVHIDKLSFIFSHSLSELPKSIGYRKALWLSLKSYYDVQV